MTFQGYLPLIGLAIFSKPEVQVSQSAKTINKITILSMAKTLTADYYLRCQKSCSEDGYFFPQGHQHLEV